MAEYILKLNGISKSFPGVRALDGVSFGVEKGTIHALVGENGAGKSTLIKILAGIYHASEGSIYFDGKENVTFKAPVDSRNAGIAVVHQEIKLAEPLTVAENMFIGNLIYTKSGLVDWKTMRKRAAQIIADLGIDIDVNAQVSSLSVAKKQIVEICKAINQNMKLLIISDVHANHLSLEAIWRQEPDCDEVCCAGDLVDYGPFPHEVIDWMKKHNVKAVYGNHDRELLSSFAKFGRDFSEIPPSRDA